jgi:hypothetical protein
MWIYRPGGKARIVRRDLSGEKLCVFLGIECAGFARIPPRTVMRRDGIGDIPVAGFRHLRFLSGAAKGDSPPGRRRRVKRRFPASRRRRASSRVVRLRHLKYRQTSPFYLARSGPTTERGASASELSIDQRSNKAAHRRRRDLLSKPPKFRSRCAVAGRKFRGSLCAVDNRVPFASCDEVLSSRGSLY